MTLSQLLTDKRLSAAMQNKLLKKKGPLLLFFLYALLVIDGTRDGYLVDCLQIGFDDALTLVDVVCQKVHAPHALTVLPLGCDVFIIRSDRLQDRIQQLLQADRWKAERPCTIDIDGSAPMVLDDDSMELIRSCLLETFVPFATPPSSPRPTTELSNLADCEQFQRSVGFPLLAGWLLGYPFVYRATSPSNALSMVPLRKVTVSGDTEGYCAAYGLAALPSEWPRVPSHIDIYEFTVPLAVLATTRAAAGSSSDSLHKERKDGGEVSSLQDVLTMWIDAKKSPQTRANNGEGSGSCTATVTTEDVSLPTLVL